MHRRILGVIGAFVLAAGVLLAVPLDGSVAYAKGRAAAKSAASKNAAGKSGKRAGTTSAKRSDGRASARAGKRSKNASSDRVSRKRAERQVERRSARKTDDRSTRVAAVKAPARDPGYGATDDDDDDQPVGPRPANRLVSDIAPARVVEIQSALMKAGVFAGPPSGVYDQGTFDAMTAFQTRNGFGATGMPTAEALKALGVRKNSGLGVTSPAVVLRSTTPSGAVTQQPGLGQTPPPND